MPISISSSELSSFLEGGIPYLALGGIRDEANGGKSVFSNSCVFPGSFNPRHIGHIEMAACAANRVRRKVIHEISVHNVDKPDLAIPEIERRLQQFESNESVVLTWSAKFVDKSQLFPVSTFIVGADTILRIGDERYYDGCKADRDAAISQLTEKGIRFLVFGRIVNGHYKSADQLSLPEPLRAICDSVTEAVFRRDISSTSIRSE